MSIKVDEIETSAVLCKNVKNGKSEYFSYECYSGNLQNSSKGDNDRKASAEPFELYLQGQGSTSAGIIYLESFECKSIIITCRNEKYADSIYEKNKDNSSITVERNDNIVILKNNCGRFLVKRRSIFVEINYI